MFARYCATYGAQVVTLDEDEHWLGVTKAIVRSLHPEANVEFQLAPRVVEYRDGEPREFKYDLPLSPKFDFVLVDGPSLFENGRHFHWAANTNVFDVVNERQPRLIVVDMRPGTVDEIERRLGQAYSCQRSDLIRRKLRPDYNYFTMFEKL